MVCARATSLGVGICVTETANAKSAPPKSVPRNPKVTTLPNRRHLTLVFLLGLLRGGRGGGLTRVTTYLIQPICRFLKRASIFTVA